MGRNENTSLQAPRAARAATNANEATRSNRADKIGRYFVTFRGCKEMVWRKRYERDLHVVVRLNVVEGVTVILERSTFLD